MRVLILGAGPASCAAAYMLKNKGITDITLVEKEALGGLSHTNFCQDIPYEFGPQIMHTADDDTKKIFEKFLTQHPPQTIDYKPACLLNGMLENAHDFPVTFANINRLKNKKQILSELSRIGNKPADMSNFENYVISRMGKTLYEIYVKNYNLKQWKIHPRYMAAEWARFMVFQVRHKPGLFPGRWQGHPGDYNPLWQGMINGAKFIKSKATISEDFKKVIVDETDVSWKYDLIISTLPLSKKLDFINTTKVFILFKEHGNIMPSYATSFPNNYLFTRIIEYKQQFPVKSNFSLLSFAFSWTKKADEKKYIDAVNDYSLKILKRKPIDLWLWSKKNVYPLSTKKTIKHVNRIFELVSQTNILPLGRSGLHAYISKDSCLRMARTVAENIDAVMAKRGKKLLLLKTLRKNLG